MTKESGSSHNSPSCTRMALGCRLGRKRRIQRNERKLNSTKVLPEIEMCAGASPTGAALKRFLVHIYAPALSRFLSAEHLYLLARPGPSHLQLSPKVDMVAYSSRLIGRRHEADRRCMDSYLERAVVVCSKRCPGGYTMTSITEISECPHERWLATSIRRPARLNSSFRRGSSGFTVSYTRQVYGHWP